MLPKPKFESNSMTTQPNNGLQLVNNWFQCSVNESKNQLLVNQSFNNNNNNRNDFNSHSLQNNRSFNQNFYNNNRNDGQKWQKSNKRFNNNNELTCDSCCRSFANESLYKSHISEHIVCEMDGCKYSAHPKVIASHQRMQHFCFRDKSLVKKFMSLDTPEDIAKWREERKANFPTKSNVQKKNVELSLKPINQTNRNKFNRNSNYGRKRKFNRFDKRNRNKKYNFNQNLESSEFKEVSEESLRNSVPINIESIVSDFKKPKLDSDVIIDELEEGEIVDSDCETKDKLNQLSSNETKVVSNIKTGALNLLAAYDSDDEIESDNKDSVIENSAKCEESFKKESPQKSESLTEKDLKVTNVIKTQSPIKPVIDKTPNNKKRNIRRPAINTRNRKLTLFEKLLMTDIRRNEDQIMECIKLIVDNNFMQNSV